MSQPDTLVAPPAGARGSGQVAPRHRRLPLAAVVAAAAIATALAYRGMVLFGLEVAGMAHAEAYLLAGFLEISLVAVALMARSAALDGRPYGVLLTLTWILSGTSGMFAALHELAVMAGGSTPYMVAFRIVPPLVAALMWHLALVGERHLVTGNTFDERRRERRVHRFIASWEAWRDARGDDTGSRASARRVRKMYRRQRTDRDRALRLLPVAEFDARTAEWVGRFEAAERHGARLDALGATVAMRRGRHYATPEADTQADPGADSVDGRLDADSPAGEAGVQLADRDDAAVQPEQPDAAAAPAAEGVAVVVDEVPAGQLRAPATSPVEAARAIAGHEQEQIILELRREGLSEREIARRTPWSRSTVNRVLKRNRGRAAADRGHQAPDLLQAVQA